MRAYIIWRTLDDTQNCLIGKLDDKYVKYLTRFPVHTSFKDIKTMHFRFEGLATGKNQMFVVTTVCEINVFI